MDDIMINGFKDLAENGIVIFLLCFVIGEMIKRTSCFKKVPNDMIPIICALIGAIAAYLCPQVFIDDTVVVRIFKGIILGWASTGFYETFRKKAKEVAENLAEED